MYIFILLLWPSQIALCASVGVATKSEKALPRYEQLDEDFLYLKAILTFVNRQFVSLWDS